MFSNKINDANTNTEKTEMLHCILLVYVLIRSLKCTIYILEDRQTGSCSFLLVKDVQELGMIRYDIITNITLQD